MGNDGGRPFLSSAPLVAAMSHGADGGRVPLAHLFHFSRGYTAGILYCFSWSSVHKFSISSSNWRLNELIFQTKECDGHSSKRREFVPKGNKTCAVQGKLHFLYSGVSWWKQNEWKFSKMFIDEVINLS